MDNLTHSLVGIALSRATFKGRLSYATSAFIFAANAPDLDLLWSGGGISYLDYHRGFSHSLLFLPVWVVLIAAVMVFFARRRAAKPQKVNNPVAHRTPELWRGYMLLALLGAGSHVLLDFTNSYGIRLLSPISEHWYAWDIEFIVDPWLWVVLLTLLLVPMLLGLVGSEVGERNRVGSRYRRSAIAALVAVVAWWGVRDFYHRRALSVLNAHLVAGQLPRSTAAFPTIGNPQKWDAVVDLPDRYVTEVIDPGDASSEATDEHTLFKSSRTAVVQAAESTRTARIFLQFARYPWISLDEHAGGTLVFFTDLRFVAPGERPQMGAAVVLDPALHIISESFDWRRGPPRD